MGRLGRINLYNTDNDTAVATTLSVRLPAMLTLFAIAAVGLIPLGFFAWRDIRKILEVEESLRLANESNEHSQTGTPKLE
jgi:hypothetical protein